MQVAFSPRRPLRKAHAQRFTPIVFHFGTIGRAYIARVIGYYGQMLGLFVISSLLSVYYVKLDILCPAMVLLFLCFATFFTPLVVHL